MMSANPTLDTAIEKRSTVNQPQILEFSVSNLKGPYKTLMPEWVGNPGFTEHTYRTFSADNENNEFILFNNSRGGNYEEWAFCDRNGKWYPGRLDMKPYVDDPIPVYNEKFMGLSYPSVVLKNREAHYFGCVALNKWSRIQNLQDAEKVGLNDIIGRGGGAIAGGRFRRVCYLWTPDVTKTAFSDWIEIDNTHENGENIRVTDMWQDPDGTMHLLWHQTPVNLRLRDQFWPDIKRVYAMKYAQVKNGEGLLKKSLVESGDSENQEKIEGMEKYSIGWGRFHVTDDNRLFMIFYVSGITPDGSQKAENRILEVYKDGSVSPSRKIPLKDPMSFFMTATHRGGTLPSKTIDVVGYGVNERLKVHYARIKLQD